MEELRCVLAVIRHGDRTPKQKMKMKITQVLPPDLAFVMPAIWCMIIHPTYAAIRQQA